ncbi:hypothetical protein NDU88_002023 [Pleurodeles waltl]|uniref:Uncharacterized protein n=1 Tax=Pleurodeles waltl TaxID=8319 RepID=A0AAV7UB40_PLEWA|nr:hypothetical protein NDU88_002023 [Pleurodeles waltl]
MIAHILDSLCINYRANWTAYAASCVPCDPSPEAPNDRLGPTRASQFVSALNALAHAGGDLCESGRRAASSACRPRCPPAPGASVISPAPLRLRDLSGPSAPRRESATPGCATGSSSALSAHLGHLLHSDAAVTGSSRRDALGRVGSPSQPSPRSRLRLGPDRADSDMHSGRPARLCVPDHGAPDPPRPELKCPGSGYFSGSLGAVSRALC